MEVEVKLRVLHKFELMGLILENLQDQFLIWRSVPAKIAEATSSVISCPMQYFNYLYI